MTTTNQPTTARGNAPLTIASRYFADVIITRSRDPEYILRLIRRLRRGDGDCITITDEDGGNYDVADIGNGRELIAW